MRGVIPKCSFYNRITFLIASLGSSERGNERKQKWTTRGRH